MGILFVISFCVAFIAGLALLVQKFLQDPVAPVRWYKKDVGSYIGLSFFLLFLLSIADANSTGIIVVFFVIGLFLIQLRGKRST